MINRIPERIAIESIYNDYHEKPGILLVYARTGVGKSRLMDHIFADKSDCCYIRVPINQQEAEETKGLYISSLAKALNSYAHETTQFLTVEEFVENIYTIDTDSEKVINDLLDIAADLIKLKVVKEKLDQNKKFKKDLISKVLQNDNDVAVSFLLNYIVYISKQKKLIISIENIQLANKRLISFLNELLRRTQNLFLIGEFTIYNTEDELTDIFRQLPMQSTEVYELMKLKKDELIGGIRQIGAGEYLEEICRIIEDSYDESYGNLIKFELLLKKSRYSQNLISNQGLYGIKYDDVVHSMYKGLTNKQKMTIWYVVAHLGRVQLQVFEKFLQSLPADHTGISESLELVNNLNLLKVSHGYINLVHDSIAELLKQEEDYQKFNLIANSDWLHFYRDFIKNNSFQDFAEIETTREDLFILQLTFILNIGGDGNLDWMNVILSEINSSIGGSVNYSLISKVTSIFYEGLENNSNKKLIYKTYEWIIIILSKLGFSNEIVRIRERYNPESPSDLLFLLQASARIATCDVLVNIELEAIQDTDEPFLYIGAQLLLIRYYRTFNQVNQSRLIWEKLLKQYQETIYKDVIIDQVNLCSFNFWKRQKLLAVSKKGHQNAGLNYHYCSTLLNSNANSFYLYCFKLIGKKHFLKAAHANLEKAKNILSASHYPMHVYLNQKSIIQFIAGNVPLDTLLKNFQTAYLNCGISGNKPLIGSNIVAVALKQNNFTGIQEYVEELMQIARKFSELNSEFSTYPLINCYNYFYKTKDKNGQREALYLLKKGKIFGDFTQYLAAVPYATGFLLRLVKYYPSNIFNWDIDFEAIEMKFSSEENWTPLS